MARDPARDREWVIESIGAAVSAAERAVESVPDANWQLQVYADGWSAKQIFAHVALTSRLWAFLIPMAEQHLASGGYDATALVQAEVDDGFWRSAKPDDPVVIADLIPKEIVAMEKTPVEELLTEIQMNADRAIARLRGCPPELLAHEFQTMWGTEGTLADLIAVSSIQDHVLVHLKDLEAHGESTTAV